MVATRFVVGETDAASLAMLRYAIGSLCLLPPLLLMRRPRMTLRDLLAVSAIGMAQFGIVVVLLNYGLRSVSAARGALIFATFPLLTMVLAALFGQERLTMNKTAGVLLTVLGVGAALGEAAAQGGVGIGEGAIFLSALTGASCSLLYRPYLQRYPAVMVSALAMLASVAFLAVLAAGQGFFTAPLPFSTAGWLAVAFIGLSSGGGFFLWLWALGKASPTRVSVFLALSPVTAALLGAALLGEPITLLGAVGIATVVGGLWVSHR